MKVLYALLLCLPAALACGQKISSDKCIEEPYQAGSVHIDKAVATIVASNDIQRQASVEYIAGKSVTLVPGFKTNHTTVFSATIQPVGIAVASGSLGEKGKGMTIYPNPAEDIVTISYTLYERTPVTISITNEVGSVMARVVEDEIQDEGSYKLEWKSGFLKPGLYICTLQSDATVSSVKLVKR